MGEISLQNHFRSKEFTTFTSLCHFSCSFAVALSRQRSANVTLLALLSSGGPTPLAPPVQWRREWKLPASLLHCLRSILPCGMRRNVFYGPRGNALSISPNRTTFQYSYSYVIPEQQGKVACTTRSTFKVFLPTSVTTWQLVRCGRKAMLPSTAK